MTCFQFFRAAACEQPPVLEYWIISKYWTTEALHHCCRFMLPSLHMWLQRHVIVATKIILHSSFFFLRYIPRSSYRCRWRLTFLLSSDVLVGNPKCFSKHLQSSYLLNMFPGACRLTISLSSDVLVGNPKMPMASNVFVVV